MAHSNLGNALAGLGRLNEAEASYRRAFAADANYAEAHNNLGNVLKDLGRLDEAESSYRRAIALRPDFAEAHGNLGDVLMVQGRLGGALAETMIALAIQETPSRKAAFVRVAGACALVDIPGPLAENLRRVVIRAITEAWGHPNRMARLALRLLRPSTVAGLRAVQVAWPVRLAEAELVGDGGWRGLVNDRLLVCLLRASVVPDMGVEHYLTCLRHALLAKVMPGDDVSDADQDSLLEFACTLGRHCFHNEYLFSVTEEESDRVARLGTAVKSALAEGREVSALGLAVLALYQPLHDLPVTERLLTGCEWPVPFRELLRVQVVEPLEERRLQAGVPCLTPIEGDVSTEVRAQYEENPFPRWTVVDSLGEPAPFDIQLRRQFPLAEFSPLGREAVEILVAGCGTGHHPIGTAMRYLPSQVLAIDLSRSSLGYAVRKTREMGIKTITYAQADILEVARLARSFDVIESVGVLHHMDDPMRAWKELIKVLRPGGFMRLGFYSALARRSVVAARAFISEQGYRPTLPDIRRCRQDLSASEANDLFEHLCVWKDFFSTSECRDLLFHACEHQLTLPEIKAFLSESQLAFIGFELDNQTLHTYRTRFPEDFGARNLDCWHLFETDNPDTFREMYQFWIQKPS